MLRTMFRPATPEDLEALIDLAQRPEVARTLATNAVDSLRDDVGELLAIEHDNSSPAAFAGSSSTAGAGSRTSAR